MSALFISYSRRDQDFARQLKDGLVERGHTVWIDWEDIPPTADWFERIRQGIVESDAFVFVISPASVASEVCAREIEFAESRGKRLVPILHRDLGDLVAPEPVARRNWIVFGDLEQGLSVLDRSLRTDLAHLEAHTRWLRDAERWAGGGRDRSLLLRGQELAAAEAWLQSAPEDPAPVQIQYEYILAGRRAQSSRQRRLLTVGAVAFLAITALAVVSLVLRGRAEEQSLVAQSRELSASALLTLPDDPELSLLLARRAAETKVTDQAEDALRQALLESRVRVSMRGGAGGLLSVALAPDGSILAAGSEDGKVLLFDTASGRRLAALDGHEAATHTVRFSHAGDLLLSAAQDGRVRLWDPRTRKLRGTLRDERDHRLTDVAISRDGRAVAVGNFRYPARVWDLTSRRTRATLKGFDIGTSSVDLSPDGRRVLVTGQDHTARVYSARDGRQLAVLRGHRGRYVWVGRFSPDGKLMATASSGGDVVVWGPGGKRLAVLSGHRAEVEKLAFSPDGRLLASGSGDGVVRLHDLADRGNLRATLTGHQDGITSVLFSPAGDSLATSSQDGTARVWEAGTGRVIAVLRGHRGPINAMAYSEDGTRLMTASSDGTVRAWAASMASVTPATRPRLASMGEVEVDPQRRLALAKEPFGRAARLIRLDGRDPAAAVEMDLEQTILAVGPQGHIAAVADFQRPAELLDRSGRVLRTLAGTGGAGAAAFSNDGRRLAVASRARVQVFDTADGRRRLDLRGHASELDERFLNVAAIRFAPGDDVLVTVGEDGAAQLWDARTGAKRRRLAIPKPPPRGMFGDFASVEFDRSGDRLLLGVGWDAAARVFDLATGRQSLTLEGHVGTITSVSFSPDDRFVTTTSWDGTARLWDPTSGRMLTIIRPAGQEVDETGSPAGTVDRAFFDTSGRRLFVAGSHGLSAYECDVCGDVASLVRLARTRVTRALTRPERVKYLHAPG